MGLLSYRTPEGERRRWTFKEIVQGYPLGHPSHPMFVHFPVAFYIACLVFDVMSKIWDFPFAPLFGTWAILGAFAGSLFAVITGLTDWATMTPGSKRRRTATRHMLLQLTTFAVFLVNLIVRWSDRHLAEAEVLWIVLDLVGVGILLVGQWLGGVLVYKLGMRVTATADQGSAGTA
ncbi:MAG: DUF2231 domain-containing protein [Actinobacteria bacterium]|nr:DUF2231 domain-containing protein [Actinomycetota bacterium]